MLWLKLEIEKEDGEKEDSEREVKIWSEQTIEEYKKNPQEGA